jgi:hypothetical protein
LDTVTIAGADLPGARTEPKSIIIGDTPITVETPAPVRFTTTVGLIGSSLPMGNRPG